MGGKRMDSSVWEERLVHDKQKIHFIMELMRENFFEYPQEEEWIDFEKLWENAIIAANYIRNPFSIRYFTEEEICSILQERVEWEQLEYDCYTFVDGRKKLLETIGKLQNNRMDLWKKEEDLFFQCLQNELRMAMYEKFADFEDSKWILKKHYFVEKMTAFVWLYVCMEQGEKVEKMQPVIKRIFPYQKIDTKEVENIMQQVDNFSEFLGKLWINQADGYDKVCCMKEEYPDLQRVGERLVEKYMKQTLFQ